MPYGGKKGGVGKATGKKGGGNLFGGNKAAPFGKKKGKKK